MIGREGVNGQEGWGMASGMTRRDLLQAGAAAGAVALSADPLVESRDGGDAGTGQTDRHRARGDPDPGEPIVRSLLRHDARCARLQRGDRRRRNRAARLLRAQATKASCCRSTWKPAAPAVLARHHPRLGAPARMLGRRRDGRVRPARTSPSTACRPGRRRWATTSGRTSRSTSRSRKRSRSATATTARYSGPPIRTACTA